MNETGFRRIHCAEARDLIERADVLLLDVRDRASFEQGCIGSALHATTAEVERMIWSAPKTMPVLIYCYHGNASQTFANMFADFGFSEVYDLIGGYEAWRLAAGTGSRAADSLSPAVQAWLAEHGFPLYSVNATIDNQTTPIMKAARLGDIAAATELVAAGADLGAKNSDGNTALWFACYSENLAVVELLASKGAPLDNQNENGASCLMYAASAGKTQVVAALLRAGADPTLQTLDDFTALDMAANLECLQLLRHAGKKSAVAA
ncbi:MAG: ankyrin repeat domain-containing protein [Burkholderiales bacterium]